MTDQARAGARAAGEGARPTRYTRLFRSTILFGLHAVGIGGLFASDPSVAELRRQFLDPPADARIMMRWWWFGCAVTKPELERELHAMKAAGIGGVEIQPVYPVALDDSERGIRNLPYLSAEFLDHLRFAVGKARGLGLRVDITLGSGWPYGGPHIRVTEAAGRLRYENAPVPAGAVSMPFPAMENGEALIAAFLARGDETERITGIEGGRVRLPHNSEGATILFFIASRTGQQVKRPAVGADGFVLDHYDRAAIERHLELVGDRLLTAFGPHPPEAVFSDSLEVYASDWTPDLLQEFRKRRGYDLTPFLPALVRDIGEKTRDIRHDWGETLTELAEERYLTPIRDWAKAHGTRFRAQTYGIPPVRLSSGALVDLPEGEGANWRAFSTARWAASTSHLYGRPITSSETWTWLHSPAFRATPLDMKAEADLHFLQGINQIVGHGWPYSPPAAGEPGWRFYAAGALNGHNPWWIVMPELTKYLQRVSYLLRQGKPANDVALYLPTDDAWAGFTLGKVSINQAMPELLGPTVIPAILEAGYNFDFIDDAAIERIGIHYAAVVLPAVKRMPPSTSQKLADFKRGGGIVVEASDIASLTRMSPPDFATGEPAVGFLHRKLDSADVYFVVNTGNRPVHANAQVRIEGERGEWWDLFSGETSPAGGPRIELNLQPYESRVLVFSREPLKTTESGATSADESLDISGDWSVKFPMLDRAVSMHELRSWSEDERTQFFSGVATYDKRADIPQSMLRAGRSILVNLGEGTPLTAPTVRRAPGMRAWYEGPVREAAVVYVNGRRAGAVWRPPYEVDITKLVKPGANAIRIEVGNLAINALAGQSAPDYKLLNLRYGVRFTPQDMNNLEPLPAGLLGPIHLISR